MPNWIEVVLAYLKQNTSLRFVMFWLVSWVFLLLITPISWTEFINSGLAAHNVPYIGSNIFLAALAFFVAQFAKYLWYRAHSFCTETKQKNNLKKAIEKLHKLTEEEENIVIYIFQNGSTEYMDEVPVSSICSLVNNKIIYSYDSNPTNAIYYLNNLYKNAIISIAAEDHNKISSSHYRS